MTWLAYSGLMFVASIASVAIFSAFLFKDELSSRKLAGIGVVVLGLLVMLV